MEVCFLAPNATIRSLVGVDVAQLEVFDTCEYFLDTFDWVLNRTFLG